MESVFDVRRDQRSSSMEQHRGQNEGGLRMSPPDFQLQASSALFHSPDSHLQGATVQRMDILTSDQVNAALAFYAGRSTDFSSNIINEIQTQLGMPPTGNMDQATLLGIAAFQQDSGLAVNGMLDSYTLPKFFPHGLATEEAQNDYADAYLDIRWADRIVGDDPLSYDNLLTVYNRAQEIERVVNAQLTAAGVPDIIVNHENTAPAVAQFSYSTWSMSIDRALLSSPNFDQSQRDRLAKSAFHEARHAEQLFNIAQLLAGQGKTGLEIATELNLVRFIGDLAAASPIAADSPKALVVREWYESIFGAHAESRRTTLENVVADTSPANYAAYAALPEESDAFRVGAEFEAKLPERRAERNASRQRRRALRRLRGQA